MMPPMQRKTLWRLLFVFISLYNTVGVPTPGVVMTAWAGNDVTPVGDALRYLLPATAVGMAILHHDLPSTLQFGKASVLTVGVTYGLKQSITEQRPNGESHSFPSGHAAISFSSAEFIRKRYGCRVGCPAYIAAAFVGYSRVESREHFVHDVLSGMAIGIASSYYFTHPYKAWYIIPNGNARRFELYLTRSWD